MKHMALKFCIICLCIGCMQSDLTFITDLPKTLKEVSGIAIDKKTNLIWMVNDSGNKPVLYSLDTEGVIIKKIKIEANNKDWEDLTTDDKGNIYIGDFGNNYNDRKGLKILKIKQKDLESKTVKPVKISFHYPDQDKFPPKKSQRHFDCEAFFYFNDFLYLFTKSRVENNLGLTNLYRIPAKKGDYKAEFLGSFQTCDDKGCWVTSADINTNNSKMALLSENGVHVFSNFENDAFFEGDYKAYRFNSNSQKESVVFKNDSTLYIADEDSGHKGGNLYEYSIQ